jgi:hypothetical protein
MPLLFHNHSALILRQSDRKVKETEVPCDGAASSTYPLSDT